MFREEIDELKLRHPDRLDITHLLSREPRRDGQLGGRIDREKLNELLHSTLRPSDVDEWFICGPQEMTIPRARR